MEAHPVDKLLFGVQRGCSDVTNQDTINVVLGYKAVPGLEATRFGSDTHQAVATPCVGLNASSQGFCRRASFLEGEWEDGVGGVYIMTSL